MYIVPISDVHTELAPWLFTKEEIQHHFGFLQDLLDTGKTTVLVAAGDIGRNFSGVLWLQKLIQYFPGLQVVFTPGNHEYYGSQLEDLYAQYNSIQKSIGGLPSTNLDILVNRHIALIDNVLFLGETLWTDLFKQHPLACITAQNAMNDYVHIYKTSGKPITTNNTLNAHFTQAKSIYKGLERAKQFKKARKDLKIAVVTHHDPLPPTDLDTLSYAFHCTDIEDKLQESGVVPDYWFSGHTHSSHQVTKEFEHGTCQFISNQFGYTHELCSQTQYQQGFYIEV